MREIFLRRFYKIIYPFLSFYWLAFSPKTNGVKVIIKRKNEILLIKNTYRHNGWTFSGGGVKRNEIPIDAAVREVKEELGIDLKKEKIEENGSFVSNLEGKRDHIYVYTYITESVNIVVDKAEIEKITWVDFEDIIKGKITISPVAKRCLKQAKMWDL